MSGVAYLVIVYRGNEVDTIDETIYTNKDLALERAYYLNSVMDEEHFEAFVEERKMIDVIGKTTHQLKGM